MQLLSNGMELTLTLTKRGCWNWQLGKNETFHSVWISWFRLGENCHFDTTDHVTTNTQTHRHTDVQCTFMIPLSSCPST